MFTFQKLRRELRADAGLATLSGKRSWVDILRHTYASFWLSLHGDRPRLAEYLGNSVDVVRGHYRKAIPPKEAERYWNTRPQTAAETKIVAFAGG